MALLRYWIGGTPDALGRSTGRGLLRGDQRERRWRRYDPATAWAHRPEGELPYPMAPTVLFRRGDTFYGELNPPFGVEIGAYGSA